MGNGFDLMGLKDIPVLWERSSNVDSNLGDMQVSEPTFSM